MHPSGQQLHSDLMPNMWTDKQHALDPRLSGLEQQHNTDHYLLSPGMSPMSMDLTNDTLQQQMAAPFGGNENESFTFSNYGTLGAAVGVAAGNGLSSGSGAGKDGTQNITDKVPGLSTLVEEDEEQLYDTSSEGVAMELTGNTDVQQVTGGLLPGALSALSCLHHAWQLCLCTMLRACRISRRKCEVAT
jgi:hypothetical protein